MIAPLSHELVDAQPEARAIAVAEPEDSRRQSLERDALAGQPNPAAQRLVVGEHLERGAIGDADVLGIAGQRRPAERSLAFAEERPDVLGHEAGNLERVGDAGFDGLGADVVAVVERDRAAALAASSIAATCRPIASIDRRSYSAGFDARSAAAAASDSPSGT